MPIRVQVGTRVVEFPDGTDQAVMAKALQSLPQAEAPPEAKPERSLSGFLGNAVNSGGRFLRDTAQGLGTLAVEASPIGLLRTAQDPSRGVRMLRAAPGAVKDGLANRYGGIEQVKNTFYNDPVGALADLSTFAGGVGLAAKTGGAGKLARIAGVVSDATNPMGAVGAATEAITRPVARTVVRGTLRAPAAVREDFGGGKAVADAVLKDRVYSEASATRKLNRSTNATDALLAERQAAGIQGPRTKDVADAVISGKPAEKATLRARLGEPDASDALLDSAIDIEQRNPPRLDLTDAQAMKREAQELAFEAGKDNKTVAKTAQKAKAQALRSGIEQQVPEVGPMNEQSQRLLGSKLAFQAAEDRPRALTNFLSILGGGAGFAGGGPFGAIALPALMKAADSPRLGAMTGIGINEFGRGMNAASLRKAALIARLQEGME